MQKRGIFVILIAVLLLPSVLSVSIDSEINKLTHYAEEYETGNINYVQLLVYLGSSRQSLNAILGATGMEHGGTFKQEQLKSFLGEPTGETRWVWFEREQREKRIDASAPTWEKIIFDGNKIQIKLNAYPFLSNREEELVYDLNFQSNFKKPQDQLDIAGKIEEVKRFAEIFKTDPTKENARTLAKESVNVEKSFESYFRQSGKKCEAVMKSIFGTENIRETQQMLVNDISFYTGENFEVKGRLEMCDNCEWNWINLDFWVEGRGPGFKPEKGSSESIDSRQFKERDSEFFKLELARIMDEMKQALEQGDYKKVLSYRPMLGALNEAWNQKSNEVWQQVDEMFKGEMEKSFIQTERTENTICNDEGICEAVPQKQPQQEFDWKSFDNKRKEKERELRKANYEERKQFYSRLFESYEKREMSFSQVEYEKRLIEEFIEFGEEICDNNVDDNKNDLMDCLDSLCAGKFCGVSEVETNVDGEIKKEKKELFCISEMCQSKEEIVEHKIMACGNHLCEANETIENCAEDCSACPQHEAVECAGKVIFKGQDEKGCPLEPICIEENIFCQTNEECQQPLCGISDCIEGKCKFTELSECRESECVDGDEKIMNCQSGERIITGTCIEGSWRATEANCPGGVVQGQPITEVIAEREVVGVECSVREDCGGENDVCSNGKCETIPQVIQIEPEQPEFQPEPPEEQPEFHEESSEEEESPETGGQETPSEESPSETESPTTGEIIFSFFRVLLGRITGKQVEGEEPPAEEPPIGEPPIGEPPVEEPSIPTQEACNPEVQDCGPRICHDDLQQCPDGSTVHRDPNNNCEFGPCSQQQPDQPGDYPEKSEQDYQKPGQDNFQGEQKPEGSRPKEPEKPPQEKGVFKVGGNCRTSLQRTEAFIYFDGWGEPFEEARKYKSEFYMGGEADWCKYEFENVKQQRKEFEKSFNEAFIKWFFEDYLANSAENWEQYVSGIFELYWKNIDTIMQTVRIMQCLELEEMTDYVPLERIKYESEFGSLEFWEEVKTAKIPGMEKEMKVISPYMKIWIFPNRQFMQYEMKKAMKDHEFPGGPEEKTKMKNEEGLGDKERELIKQNKEFMDKIRNIADKFGGNVDVALQFKDYNTNEIVFNLYAQINENDVLKLEPMLPEEVPEKDVTIEIDFEKIYDFIYFSEKEMRGAEEQYPPWDRKPFAKGVIRGIVNGVQMWLKMRAIMNSAQVSPESARGDAMSLAQDFFEMMGEGDQGKMQMEEQQGEGENLEEDIFGSKEEITGGIIFG